MRELPKKTHPFLSLRGIIYVTWYTSDLPEPTGVLTVVVMLLVE